MNLVEYFSTQIIKMNDGTIAYLSAYIEEMDGKLRVDEDGSAFKQNMENSWYYMSYLEVVLWLIDCIVEDINKKPMIPKAQTDALYELHRISRIYEVKNTLKLNDVILTEENMIFIIDFMEGHNYDLYVDKEDEFSIYRFDRDENTSESYTYNDILAFIADNVDTMIRSNEEIAEMNRKLEALPGFTSNVSSPDLSVEEYLKSRNYPLSDEFYSYLDTIVKKYWKGIVVKPNIGIAIFTKKDNYTIKSPDDTVLDYIRRTLISEWMIGEPLTKKEMKFLNDLCVVQMILKIYDYVTYNVSPQYPFDTVVFIYKFLEKRGFVVYVGRNHKLHMLDTVSDEGHPRTTEYTFKDITNFLTDICSTIKLNSEDISELNMHLPVITKEW